MPHCALTTTCLVVPFPLLRAKVDRLTVRDRIDALEWESNAAPPGARILIYERSPEDAPEITDYIAVYRPNERWTSWAITRDGARCHARCFRTDHNVGAFGTVRDALDALFSTHTATGTNGAAMPHAAFRSNIVWDAFGQR